MWNCDAEDCCRRGEKKERVKSVFFFDANLHHRHSSLTFSFRCFAHWPRIVSCAKRGSLASSRYARSPLQCLAILVSFDSTLPPRLPFTQCPWKSGMRHSLAHALHTADHRRLWSLIILLPSCCCCWSRASEASRTMLSVSCFLFVVQSNAACFRSGLLPLS